MSEQMVMHRAKYPTDEVELIVPDTTLDELDERTRGALPTVDLLSTACAVAGPVVATELRAQADTLTRPGGETSTGPTEDAYWMALGAVERELRRRADELDGPAGASR